MFQYYIGTSGWYYDDWRGVFYPRKLPKERWLEFYASSFPTVEINNTFYRLPTEKAAKAWYDESPIDFFFSVKVSRYLTHVKRLKDADESIKLLISKISPLKEKLRLLLYQLPENFHRDDKKLEGLLSILPRGYKHAIEFRHKSWYVEKIYELLKKYNAAFCIYDMPGRTSPVMATADFAYIRFHGKDSIYTSKYSEEDMKEWAETIKKLAVNLKEVYIYFNNDTAGYAINNARMIKKYLE